MANIATIGAGGLGVEIAALIRRDLAWAGYFDDNVNQKPGFLGRIENLNEDQLSVLSIGNPIIKKKLICERLKSNYNWLLS